MLLNPVFDPVDDWLEVDYENERTVVRPSSAAKSSRAINPRVEKTIEFFGLNTVLDLVEHRDTQVNAAIFAMGEWRKKPNDADAQKIRELSNRYTAHGWAVRRVATDLAPDLALPTPEEDLKWLVDWALKRLDKADSLLAGNITAKDRELVEAQKKESSWTLAVLWKDPPCSSPDVVENWINIRNRRAEIKELLDRLNAVE